MNNIHSSFLSKYLKSNLNLFLKISGISFLAASQAFIASSASAGTALSAKETFSGKVNYTGTGGTLRSNPDSINPCSLNSTSTAQLSGIPSNATVKKAYLYWGGSGSTVDSSVTLDGTSLTADQTYTDTYSTYSFFQGVKDVTSKVVSKRNGNYQFKDLSVSTSSTYCGSSAVLSAWSLIVIYEDPSIPRDKLNTIRLYEGFKASRYESVNYTLGGIQVANNPVAKFTMLLWEGDESLGGTNEKLGFNSHTLTDLLNPINNQFNSSINTLNLSTTYGVDLDTFNISSYVTPGQTSVTGTVSTDADLVLQSAALIMVTDTLANESPSAQPDTITTDEDNSVDYNLIRGNPTNDNGKDTDPEGDALTVTKFNVGGTEYTLDAQTTNRQVTMPSGALLTVKSNGDVTYNPNGRFESLNPGQTAQNPDSFTYTISDTKGTSSATATVNINGVADDPVAVDDTATTDEDTVESIPVLQNDSDPNTARENLTITKIKNTTVSVGEVVTLDSGATVKLVQINDSSKHSSKGKYALEYDPRPSASLNLLNRGQQATPLETFTYTVRDPEGNTGQGNVTVTVDGITDTYSD
ncbi:Ig-like domain-containing protein [Pleurocapsa sp. FMAR1]|uniref:Ig-like domain-containing protein n=1 Tax=Pleurocapsa sp. FMAR1 TaxID=3040204 RepID=UPI0029C73DAA|nr:Ig-like domain-containing protein [Pleurocapsa sp. FMAR1]